MNGNNNNNGQHNNGQRDWRVIYAQWDREELEEELVRQADQIRALKDERNQLQSRVRQLELSLRGDAPPTYDQQEGGVDVGAAAAAESDTESEHVQQSSGRFQVEVVPVESMLSDPYSV